MAAMMATTCSSLNTAVSPPAVRGTVPIAQLLPVAVQFTDQPEDSDRYPHCGEQEPEGGLFHCVLGSQVSGSTSPTTVSRLTRCFPSHPAIPANNQSPGAMSTASGTSAWLGAQSPNHSGRSPQRRTCNPGAHC